MSGKVFVSRELETGEWHETVIPNVAVIDASSDVGVYLRGNAHLVLLKSAPKLRLERFGHSMWGIRLY